MGFGDIFKKKKPYKPEDDYLVTVTESTISVLMPDGETTAIEWDKIQMMLLINTDQGPCFPDIFLVLAGHGRKVIFPHGNKKFDEVFERISKFEGFDFHAFRLSMKCTDNVEFILWGSKDDLTGFTSEDQNH